MGLPMPFGNPTTYLGHSGVDFPQPDGTPIRASGNGVVGLLSWNYRGGFLTWIDYDGGPGVAYAHQWQHYVPEGMRVSEGTIIGYVGSSGRSTGPHLHIEIADEPGEAAVWRYFDRGRVVGSGSAASSSGATPLPGSTEPPTEEEEMPVIISSASGQSLIVGPVMVHLGSPAEVTQAMQNKNTTVFECSVGTHDSLTRAFERVAGERRPFVIVNGSADGTVYTWDGGDLEPIYDPATIHALTAIGVDSVTWSAGEIQRRVAAKK